MVIQRGDIWWANLDAPTGSEPGYRRPVMIVQADWASSSGLKTVIAIALTSNTDLAEAPGNVLVQPRDSGLSKPSVVNVSQILTINRLQLEQRVGRLVPSILRAVEDGMRIFLDL